MGAAIRQGCHFAQSHVRGEARRAARATRTSSGTKLERFRELADVTSFVSHGNGLRDGSAVARSAGSWNFFLRICNVWPVTGHSYM